MKSNIFKIILLFFTLPFFTLGQNAKKVLQETLENNAEKYNLTSTDISNWKIENHHKSQNNEIGYYYLHQTYTDIPIYNAISVIATKGDKGFLTSNGFISGVESKVETSSATISAVDAIKAAARNIGVESTGEIKEISNSEKNKFVFAAKELSIENIDVVLKLFAVDQNSLRAVWDLHIYQIDQKHWWSIRVDAQSSEVLDKTDWVLNCSFDHDHSSNSHQNCRAPELPESTQTATPPPGAGVGYNVFPIPVESPIHGSRQLVIDPDHPLASPFGWHDVNGVTGAEYTITRGNNVYAYEDRADANAPGYSPDGGSTLNFDFPLDFNQQPTDYEDAALTNLFYMNNIMHDIWYQYGFDEASGNFQANNYGNGGIDGDYVMAEAQDGGGTNNANMATGPDGYNPRMQMYLWFNSSSDLLTVNSPPSISGGYDADEALFGPGVPTTPITSNLVIYDDNVGETMDACQPAVNASAINGKIVLVKRGSCNFTDKVQNAENAGALAVIVVNDVPGNTIEMGGTDPGIGIPSIMISNSDGNDLIFQASSGLAVNVTLQSVGGMAIKDGDFDNGIIAHEYGHGISNRLTGGAASSGCLSNDEQMGEGWSDFFGLMLTIEPGDLPEDPRGIGNFAKDYVPDGPGIRPLPYSTDFAINDITYAATNNVNGISRPHGIGFVWASMLWDLNWALVDRYGYDADIYNGTGGNNMAMQLVIEGLKLQGCEPGFVDGRDAILQADQLLYNGDNECLIWQVFAKRGLGYSANQGSPLSRTDQAEAFDIPPNLILATNVEQVFSCGDYTWAENGQTYTESGNYIYSPGNSYNCDSLVSLELTIQQIDAIIYSSPNGVTLKTSNAYNDYQWIDCDNGNAPIPGATGSQFTPTENGSYAVTITVGSCSETSVCKTVSTVSTSENTLNEVSIYPNPTKGNVELDFGKQIERADVNVYDATGRLIQSLKVENTQKASLLLKGENGIYTVEIITNKGEVYRNRMSKID